MLTRLPYYLGEEEEESSSEKQNKKPSKKTRERPSKQEIEKRKDLPKKNSSKFFFNSATRICFTSIHFLGGIYDDEQEREKQRAIEEYKREEELRRKEAELAQQKLKKLAEQQSSTPKSTQTSPKVADDPLEKQILEKLKKEKEKQKTLDKEEQGGGILGFVSALIAPSDKDDKEDEEPKGIVLRFYDLTKSLHSSDNYIDEIVDGLRKLAEERKLGLAPQGEVVGIDEFVPEGDDEGNFWGDEEPQVNNEKKEESSEEVCRR